MDLRPHAARWPFTLEKWYLDALTDDGAVLIVYVARLRAFGLARGRVTAALFRPSCPVVRGDAPATRWKGGEDWLDAGAASIDHGSIHFELAGLSGRLVLTPRHPPALLGEPLLARDDRRLGWTVEIPDADARGEVRWPGGELIVEGRGYRDRVWFDLLPWRFPIRELAWGRVAAGPHASTWMVATTDQGEVSAGWADGQVVAARAAMPASLDARRVLVDEAVADLPGLHLGPLRPLLRRLAGDPREVKWAAGAIVAGQPGLVIDERVRWS